MLESIIVEPGVNINDILVGDKSKQYFSLIFKNHENKIIGVNECVNLKTLNNIKL